MKIVDVERAEPLALLRIVVPLLVLAAPGLREGVRVAAWDPALRVVPEGLGWFVALVPISAGLARGVEVVTVFAALCAAVGLRARPALVVLTLGAFYLYAIAQLTGFVWHDMHLLWMCALLAASPCDHALAYDQVVPRAPSRAYGVSLTFARVLLGSVYFFPGFHKLHEQGLGWALSDNLRNQLWWKWAEHGVTPTFRIDLHPWMLHAGGLFVLAFELGAPILFLLPRTRALGAILGIGFHLLAELVFRIPFAALWACYVVLFDVRVAFPNRAPASEEPARTSPWTLAVGGALLLGVLVQGARGQTQSYPFACYPTFQYDPGATMPDLRLVATLEDGRVVDVPQGKRTQRQWGTIFALVGATHEVSEKRLHAYWSALARAGATPAGVVRVRALRATTSVSPDDHGRVVREEELATFTP